MKRGVFFDRDGIVNRSPGPGYVQRWEDFHLMPDFPAVLRAVRNAGYEAIVVTNQRGVARGLMTAAAVDAIHERLAARLQEEFGLRLLDILCCPHGDGQCECRKPQPGMLLAAAARHDIDLARSWMVGDSERDIEAGRRAGCRTVRVGGSGEPTQADYRVDDLAELERLLRRLL